MAEIQDIQNMQNIAFNPISRIWQKMTLISGYISGHNFVNNDSILKISTVFIFFYPDHCDEKIKFAHFPTSNQSAKGPVSYRL